jgi:hypothetical protein
MRNPWRFSFDPLNGDLWIGDVGQNLYEEIDYEPYTVTAGRNYGWRCYEGLHTFNTNGCAPASTFTGPVWEYQHSSGNCSVTGGYVYRGAKYADMYGKYFFTDYCVNQMRTLRKNGTSFSHVNLGTLASGSYVAFGVDRWGEMYAADAVGGRVMRFGSTACNPVAAINGDITDTISLCDSASVLLRTPAGKDFHYTWIINGLPRLHDYDTLSVGPGSDILLTVTDSAGCQAFDSVHVRIAPTVPVSFTGLDSLYCVYSTPVSLLPSPAGGVFSGPGISGLTFDPAVADTGSHAIVYTYSDNYGCSRTATDSVVVDLCVGMDDFSSAGQLRIYPNPGDGRLRLRAPMKGVSGATISVSDITGKVVFNETVSSDGYLLDRPMDLSMLEAGGYLLRLTVSGGGSRHARVVIAR